MQQPDFDLVARQVLRALRSKRSQAATSKRLGFRSNVSAKWESGQRMPSAVQALVYGSKLGANPWPALQALNPNAKDALGDPAAPNIAAWLTALKGTQSLAAVAGRSQLSRYSVGRVLSGHSSPRLPQFLVVLDAITGRAGDFLDAWIGIHHVPLLQERVQAGRAAREALFQRPMCLAVLCLLDTRPLDAPKVSQIRTLTATLETTESVVVECLDTLTQSGAIQLKGDRYTTSGTSLTFDAQSSSAQERAAKHFWTGVGHERSLRPRSTDVCSYNVFSVARRDYERLRELQREFYRGARALIAASEPTELAACLIVQLCAWDPATEVPSL
jgi:hypothetical protein